jgi:hypothetical protein
MKADNHFAGVGNMVEATSGILRDSQHRAMPFVSAPFRDGRKSAVENWPKSRHFRGSGG